MSTELIFPEPPALPQMAKLPEIAGNLWRCPEIKAIWIGGSFGAGNADRFSDLDIRAVVDTTAVDLWRWRDLTEFFGDEYLEGQVHDFTGNGILRHFLGASSTLYDLWILDIAKDLPGDNMMLLGCRDEALGARIAAVRPMPAFVPSTASPEVIRDLIVDYWITTSKDVKVITRGLGIVLNAGLEVQSTALLRLWYVQATGDDPGTSRVTIHIMTRMIGPIVEMLGVDAQRVLGAPARTIDECIDAVEQIRDEVARVGRILAGRLGFDYPERLESVVRRQWESALP